jgi:hypothetical protein
MAAGVAGDADLRLATEDVARLAHAAVVLAKVDSVGAEALCQRDAVVDDERNVTRAADRLQRPGEARCLVLVDAFHTELERATGPQRARARASQGNQPHVERRDQVELAAVGTSRRSLERPNVSAKHRRAR